jgi:hypothetical protein
MKVHPILLVCSVIYMYKINAKNLSPYLWEENPIPVNNSPILFMP